MKFMLKHTFGLALQENLGDTLSLYQILDGLWGHLSKVSQTYYTLREDTFSHIDVKDVTKAQIFSLAYHEWLGIGYDHLPANLRIQHIDPHEVQTQLLQPRSTQLHSPNPSTQPFLSLVMHFNPLSSMPFRHIWTCKAFNLDGLNLPSNISARHPKL
ncbi:hypothetical protein BDN71DRAFT_1509098 [Pleurotus eryngii]|uniref:Uncharacterized protein n=1 Tax=Pleurotus eryngii TaxID=5323 RepID=A0A9P6DDH8_PLEER|nr:hypothetical protein BDN71DRAFT_1509098 [Pleurotus eryngii]